MAQIGLPIYITENGISDKDMTNDFRRKRWISHYQKAVSLALEDGIDIRGYYYWTLVDNFEWDTGWSNKFGLYSFDRDSQVRTLKEGASVYASIIKKARSGDFTGFTDDHVNTSM